MDLERLPKDRKALGRAIRKLIDFAEKRAATGDPYIARLRRTKPATFRRALGRYDAWLGGGLARVDRKRKDQLRRDVALIYEAIHRRPYGRTIRPPTVREQPAYSCPMHAQDCPEGCSYMAKYTNLYYSDLPKDGSGRARGELLGRRRDVRTTLVAPSEDEDSVD